MHVTASEAALVFSAFKPFLWRQMGKQGVMKTENSGKIK